jgi:hypothetical protein
MIRKALPLLALSAVIFVGDQICRGQNFSKSTELSPITMSYSDIHNLLNKIDSFIGTANGEPAPVDSQRSVLSISDGQNTFKQKNNLSSIDLSQFPKVGYKLEYN